MTFLSFLIVVLSVTRSPVILDDTYSLKVETPFPKELVAAGITVEES